MEKNLNYSIMINKAIQKYLINIGKEKNKPLWQLGIKPFYIITQDNKVELCGEVEHCHEEGKRNFLNLRLYNLKTGIFELKNIKNDYIILYKNKANKFKKISLSKAYFEDDILDVYIVCFDGNQSLCVYKNNELILEEKNVKEYKYVKEKTINYSKINEITNTAKILSFDIESNIKNNVENNIFFNDNTSNRLCGYVDYEWFLNEKYIKFYFSYSETNCFSVLFNFVTKQADKVVIIKNDILEDDTINYEVSFSKEKINDIEYCFYLTYYKEPQYLKILNYPICYIMDYIDKSEIDKRLLCVSDKNLDYLFKSIDDIKKYLNFENNEELKEYIKNKYGKINLGDYKARKNAYIKYTNATGRYDDYFNGKYAQKYREDYNECLKENKLNTRWKSEQELFRLVSYIYNDTVYQYKSNWLQKMSLDIFIPSLNVGIEYQGLQHFESIDYFGGETGLKKTKERDKRKLQLCEKNNVKLLYWNYNEDITLKLLQQKLNSIGINLEIEKDIQQNYKRTLNNVYINFEKIDRIYLELEK